VGHKKGSGFLRAGKKVVGRGGGKGSLAREERWSQEQYHGKKGGWEKGEKKKQNIDYKKSREKKKQTNVTEKGGGPGMLKALTRATRLFATSLWGSPFFGGGKKPFYRNEGKRGGEKLFQISKNETVAGRGGRKKKVLFVGGERVGL